MDRTTETEIQRIYDRDKEVRASVVVDEARDEESPLHPRFEWDDAKAAHAHRLSTARELIRCCPVIVKGQPEMLIHVPSITNGEEGAYKPACVVVKIEGERERAIRELRSMLPSILNRLKVLGDSPPVKRATKAIERAAKEIAKV